MYKIYFYDFYVQNWHNIAQKSGIFNISYTLLSLKYRCVECDKKLKPPSIGSLTVGVDEPHLCDYTGLSFCGACHWSATSPIPAR